MALRFTLNALASSLFLLSSAGAESPLTKEPAQFRPGSGVSVAAGRIASDFNRYHGTYRGLLPVRRVADNREVVVRQNEAEVTVDAKGLGLKWAVADLGIFTANFSFPDLAQRGVARAQVQYLSPEVSSWYQSIYVASVGLMMFKQAVQSPTNAKDYQWAPDLVIVARPSDPNGPPAVFYRYDQPERRKVFEQLVAATRWGGAPDGVYLFEEGERDKQTNWQIFTSLQPSIN